MTEFLQTLLIACIPSIVTGIATYCVASKNSKSQMKEIEKQNKNDLEKLMKQHEIDIDNLKETHKLEIERMDIEHKNKLELQQKEFENILLRQEKEGENAMTAEAVKGLFNVFGNAMNIAMETEEGRQLLSDSLKESQTDSEKGE